MQNMYPCNDGFCMIGSLQNNLKNEDVRGNEPFVMEVTDDDRTMLAVFYNRSLEETNRLVFNSHISFVGSPGKYQLLSFFIKKQSVNCQ